MRWLDGITKWIDGEKLETVTDFIFLGSKTTVDGDCTWVGKILWGRDRLLTLVFWSGEFHGQRRLVGYSPWGCKRIGHTWRLNSNTFHFKI